MKIIIDPYRGGEDTGKKINDKYEKDLLLELSKYMENLLKNKNISTTITRNNDISLSDEKRNNIINEIKENNDLIIQNRLNNNDEFNIIYPIRNNDELPSLISTELAKNNIIIDNYYQQRLPSDTSKDYYSIIRNNSPNETIIIEYNDIENYKQILPPIVNAIYEYLIKENTYTIKKGDSLYSIAKKYNITVDELKKVNNLYSNNLTIGKKIYIPKSDNLSNNLNDENTKEEYLNYTIKKGNSLYSIAKTYNVTVSELKKINNLTSNILQIGDTIKVPIKEEYLNYTIKKGDSLYNIAKTYNVTVSELKKLNNLTSNILQIGKIIKIPR